jgi:tRNA threonylcarbamoyladenosine biosynthesis protein TsaB
MRRGHAEAIAPICDAVMRSAGARFEDLDAIAVTSGPGSFTGVRVGLAFARGLSTALGIPAVGITSLEVVARQGGDAGLRLGVHPAALGEVYAAAYADGVEILAPQRLSAPALAARLKGATGVAAGMAARRMLTELGPGWRHAADDLPDPVALARLAGTRPRPDAPPRPTYLRPPDAKLPGGIDPWRDDPTGGPAPSDAGPPDGGSQ